MLPLNGSRALKSSVPLKVSCAEVVIRVSIHPRSSSCCLKTKSWWNLVGYCVFLCQRISSPNLNLETFSLVDLPGIGDVCVAQSPADDLWYRVVYLGKPDVAGGSDDDDFYGCESGLALVHFVDFGFYVSRFLRLFALNFLIGYCL